jgi:SAM-dependent methyltransferase
MLKTVYENPKYYEIAFSFRDVAAEVDTFERCFADYAELPVRHILEIGCGSSPHLEELLRRGYTYTGLDISRAMLAYSSKKAAAMDGQARFVHADMIDFSMPQTFDFAFIALGSLCARNTDDLFSHFRSVARALNQGGLYLLDWCIRFAPFSVQDESWSMEQEGIQVRAAFSEKLVDAVEQLVEETLSLEVIQDGSRETFSETGISRVMFPQEFLQIIHQIEALEFIGWWNTWDLDKPLDDIKDPKQISRPIVLLRKK